MPESRADTTALLDEVIAWRDRPAKADIRGLPVVSIPALGRLRSLVPEGAAQRTLAGVYAASVRLSQPERLLRQSGVESIKDLGQRPLADCDAQARGLARQSGWLAGGAGAAFGLAGAAGLVADAPALLLVGLRALVRIGYCFGEQPSPALVAALFALASADSEDEKRSAWCAVLSAPAGGGDAAASVNDAALRDGLERAAEREFAKQALSGSLQKLAATMAQRLGTNKLAGALPVIGAAVGGAVNIRFAYLLCEAARMGFIARRLLADGLPLQKLLAAETTQLAAAASASAPRKPRAAAVKIKRLAKAPALKKPAKPAAPRRRRPSPTL